MTNKLLIPIDFSAYSTEAIDYACHITKDTPWNIDLIHIFTDHSNIYRNSMEDTDLIDPRVAIAKREVNKIIREYESKFPHLNFRSIFKDGNLFDVLRETVDNDIYDAIIMGTKGAFRLDALLVGSNTYEVFQNTKIPVIAVPQSEKVFNTDKIGLLCNFKEGEIEVLKQAVKVYGSDFELVLIHINTTNDSIHLVEKKFDIFIENIILETGIDNISYVIKAQTFFIQYKEDISSAINSVIADELIDVLLVTKSKKGFLRKVIEENIVKKMAFQLQIPKFFGKSSN